MMIVGARLRPNRRSTWARMSAEPWPRPSSGPASPIELVDADAHRRQLEIAEMMHVHQDLLGPMNRWM